MNTNVEMQYRLEDLVDDKNKSLYDELSSRITVTLAPSADHYWGSRLQENTGVVFHSPTNYPGPCFAHEMLHLKLRLDGLTMPFVFSASQVDKFTLNFLYNELAHHRMFPLFLGMGYDGREFYNDFDADQSLGLLQSEIARLKVQRRSSRSQLSGLDVARPYLLLYSPGWKRGGMRRIAEQLDEVAERSFLKEMDSILMGWIESDTLDMRQTFARIFKACGITDIGFAATESGEEMILSREA